MCHCTNHCNAPLNISLYTNLSGNFWSLMRYLLALEALEALGGGSGAIGRDLDLDRRPFWPS